MTNKIQKKVTHYVCIDFNLSIYLKVLVIVFMIYIIDKDIRTNWKKIFKFCFYPNRSTISFPNQEEVYFVLIRSNIVDHMVRVVVIIQPFYAAAAQWALSKYRIILLYKTVGQPGFAEHGHQMTKDHNQIIDTIQKVLSTSIVHNIDISFHGFVKAAEDLYKTFGVGAVSH